VHSVLSDATVLELVEHVYAAGCDPRRWQSFVEEVHARLPGIAFTTHLDMTDCHSVAYSVGFPPEYIESYLAHYHVYNPYSALLARLQEGRVYCSEMLGTRSWIGGHIFFNEWLKPAGNFTHGASVVLARNRRRLMRVTMDMPDRLGHLEETCVVLLDRLGPHMMRAFEVNEQLQKAVATEAALAGTLDRIEGAALVLGAQARITALNRRAEDLARTGSLIRIDASGRLAFQHPDTEAAFQQALAVALGALKDGVPFAFPAPEQMSVVVLPLRPAAGNAAWPSAIPRALLVVRRAGTHAVLPGDLLKALYGLTNAEIRLVLRIAAGVSVADAANALGVTRTTARNQLAAAMGKVGVHRQGELVAAVAGLAPCFRFDCDR
jgi:DNA-binding CsgD family transcriptional regulator